MRSRLRSAAAWFGLVAALLASLAPTLSHALAAANGGPAWGAVCTAVPAADRGTLPGTPGPGAVADEACPYCLQPAFGTALPPAAPALLPLAADGTSIAAPAGTPAARPQPWPAAAPRGPPARA